MVGIAARYGYQVWKKEISPTLSTWLIFLVGTSLSLVTYAIAEKRDFLSGILNTMDVAVVAGVVVAILLWGDRRVRFKRFDKWYLVGVGVIVLYGALSGDAWTSNLFTQILITTGYGPTVWTLVTEKRNTESFSVWGLVGLAGFFALYPAMHEGNLLAVTYSLRTIGCVALLIAIMWHYERVARRNNGPPHRE